MYTSFLDEIKTAYSPDKIKGKFSPISPILSTKDWLLKLVLQSKKSGADDRWAIWSNDASVSYQ
jgi:hypothetical protein